MIKTVCPHCENNIEVVDDMTIYNLNRLGESLHKCSCCENKFLIYYDGEDIKALRASKR